MIARLGMAAALTLCIAGGTATTADAAAPRPGTRVYFQGCMQFGIPPWCRVVGNYVVNHAHPALPMGTFVRASATVDDFVGLCPGGIYLKDVRWRPVNRACPR